MANRFLSISKGHFCHFIDTQMVPILILKTTVHVKVYLAGNNFQDTCTTLHVLVEVLNMQHAILNYH